MIALDLGASSLKRVNDEGPVADPARGALRTPAAQTRNLAEAVRACGQKRVALVLDPDETLRRALLDGGLEQVELVPAALALAIAADEEPAERAVWAVLDAGHSALRVHLVRWHRLGDRLLPRIEKTLLVDPSLGGAALDRALAKDAWSSAALPAADELSARGFYEVKELAPHVRGPLGRPVALAAATADVEVPAHAVKSAFAQFIAHARAVAPEVARLCADATTAISGGGLFELAPFRAALAGALGPKAVFLEQPLHAAARGALGALDAPIAPRAAASLSLLARRGTGVAALELAPEGALLPARFGPVTVSVAAANDPLELAFVEGDAGARSAVLPRRPLQAALSVEVEWSWEHGWRLLPQDGAPVPLVATDDARAKAAREALGFDFSKHAEGAPIDALFVFVATKGEGPLLARSVEAIAAIAARTIAKAKNARVGAIAVGDHPQGGVKPRYVTLAHPLGDVSSLERFLADQSRDPVEGVDAPEALECALAKASETAWRSDAEKVIYVLTDVPPHEKTEPPFCQVDWRDGVKKLRSQGVTLVPVLLEGAALAPDIARRTRAFLDALRTEGEPVHAVRSKATDGLLTSIDRLAAKTRADAAGRDMLARIAVAAG